MGMIQEFKEFAMRGNVVDMAVGVVIGGAFGKIVTSLVGDIIMPAVGAVTGGLDFSEWKVQIAEGTPAVDGAEAVEPVMLSVGNFLNAAIDFVIIAFAIFMAIKLMNRLQEAALGKDEPAEEGPPEPPEDIKLLREIRDSLNKG
ncbi:Large-conductance mechanosensitive channel [Pseudobythopirellula maris]|uniref:Large-conductance mechanosensitive channel n=1 Tax=Pseudobythopirellula maris TaxID=2527991 RepID=A0A5C5ZSX9_9BACT|nr:large-conductance mechanosensitive channel protein MscL [Pseudobythopirellula maris]TWT90644.1 Large-conductance mechanosensitive channel [Pseudobythopirellula maris]